MDVSPSLRFSAPASGSQPLPAENDPRGMRAWQTDHFGSPEPPRDTLGDFLSTIMGGTDPAKW